MPNRGKPAATTALVPFECPECSRDYRVELDFLKMRRLNRIAVCPSCNGRYSLSVRLEKSAAPFDPDPYAAERTLGESEPRRDSSIRRVRDGRPGRASQPVVRPSSEAPVYVIDSSPPADSFPPGDSVPPARSTPPRGTPRATTTPPPPASEPALRRARTEPSRRPPHERLAPRGRQDTVPTPPPFGPEEETPPFTAEARTPTPPPTSDPVVSAPLSDRRPRRHSSGRHERTLEGVGDKAGAAADGKSGDGKGVGVHVIVEVGLVGKPNSRKTTRSYRPEHLVTLPGIGLPKKSSGDG